MKQDQILINREDAKKLLNRAPVHTLALMGGTSRDIDQVLSGAGANDLLVA